MLISDITRDAEQGLHLTVAPDATGRIDALTGALDDLAVQARGAIAEDGYDQGVVVEYAADLRYRGQSHELTVSLNDGIEAESVRDAFHRAHRERFGFASLDTPVEVVTARAKARHPGHDPGRDEAIAVRQQAAGSEDGRAVVTWHQPLDTRILPRSLVAEPIRGPAIITQIDTTVTVPPGWIAARLLSGSLLLSRESHS